ncbi:hypothetical protein [Vibrio sp. 10N.261.55.A7]|uniref:hypothetical protein n=1 Tax=Vibrio sp. 10N.261.55.A7 TaxID=1880851 RepID=UPI000C81D051|nr:hypothetical protein [Vibrio sp. 10N.261.55.A7]PMJ95699.1 hypothetical protein BCU12_04935 [Vibrio sp. 10N.261.55.A7]
MMNEKSKALYCGKCNQSTEHAALTPSEVEAQTKKKNAWHYQLLSLIAGIVFSTDDTTNHISYYRCAVCGSDYQDRESMPHGF